MFTFPGFTLLENDQICTFYVNLWEDMDPLESQFGCAFFKLFPLTSNRQCLINFLIQNKPIIDPESHNFYQCI